jgi:hypothetical protein
MSLKKTSKTSKKIMFQEKGKDRKKRKYYFFLQQRELPGVISPFKMLERM